MLVPLQAADGTPLAIAGTFAIFALFLSVTAHIAARNVLGDVPIRNGFLIGPVPAAVSIIVSTFAASDAILFGGLLVAIVLDGLAIGYVYGESRTLSAYITLIHFVVSVILGTVLVGVWLLATSAPA
ncbi:DUF7473 family protein [Halobellus captivus]|uniref:DUF7473 family protein n=1 Tax=Halobellus captivus TaxID=2592614 RepID=UPI0011A4C831|nr:hypothetical protein [Halobellus captivus]